MKNKITMRTIKQFLFEEMARLFGTSHDIEYIYNEDFFKDNINLTKSSAQSVVDLLLYYFHPASVLDIGCGPGVYLREFKNRGIRIQGVEGSGKVKNHLLVPQETVIIHDLRKSLELHEKYDLVLCFEVAEHLPEKSAENLVRILTVHGDTIIFTAAPPGQGGKNHINEQPEAFWKDLFAKCAYVKNEDVTAELRTNMRERHVIEWMYKNIFVFQKI